MNTYFNPNESFDSNKRIIEACFPETAVRTGTYRKWFLSVFSILFFIARAVTSEKARRIAKVSGVAISLVGFVGIIGAMECGTLGLGSGLLLGALLIGLEYLCLRPKKTQRS